MMKKTLLRTGALLLLLAGGCTTESEHPYAPYYYPNTSIPYTQAPARTPIRTAAAVAAPAPLQLASSSANPAN